MSAIARPEGERRATVRDWRDWQWLRLTMNSIRGLVASLAYLQSLRAEIHLRHYLGWPVILLEQELQHRQHEIADACVAWFDDSAFKAAE